MNKRRSLTESEIIKKEPIQNSESDEMNDWIYLFIYFSIESIKQNEWSRGKNLWYRTEEFWVVFVIHWHESLQYCKVISLQLIKKINLKKFKKK